MGKWGAVLEAVFPSILDCARCIRRRAELSVAMNPACPSESAAARAVQDAWEHCFKDRAPFPQALENPPTWGR